jgi:AraC family transcriptional regulator
MSQRESDRSRSPVGPAERRDAGSCAATTRTLATSESLGWRATNLRHLWLAPASIPHGTLSEHFLGMVPAGACDIHWKIAGQFYRRRLAAGDFWTVPAGVDASMSWSEPHETVRYSLDPALVTRVAREVGGSCVTLRADPGRRDPNVARVLRALQAEASSPGGASALFAEALAMELAVLLLRAEGGSSRPSPSGLARPKLRAVCDFVDAHVAQAIDLRSLAGVAGLSVYHFARQFRASTGIPPHRYVTERRIEHAKRLLLEGRSILEVAGCVGFASPSHFAKVFARVTGLTPRAWRRGQ